MATGTYRKLSNRVWDAYPEYLISAFGLHLDIQLHQNSEFISKNIKVSYPIPSTTYIIIVEQNLYFVPGLN